MNKINLPQAAKLTSPNPVSVVCTMKPDGSTNLATVSWWTYLSFNPNMIAYAMAKTSYSGEMVRFFGYLNSSNCTSLEGTVTSSCPVAKVSLPLHNSFT